MSAHAVDPVRLCSAADALLDAVASGGREALICVRVDEPDDDPRHPDAPFSQDELVQAMSMLLRLDLI